jgi:hypothetical protein
MRPADGASSDTVIDSHLLVANREYQPPRTSLSVLFTSKGCVAAACRLQDRLCVPGTVHCMACQVASAVLLFTGHISTQGTATELHQDIF